LMDLVLMDDTPAANGETKAWLQSLIDEPQSASPKLPGPGFALNGHSSNGWQHKFVDSYALAQEALKSGREQKAFEILHSELQKQQTGRGRFERRIQLVQLCVSTGKEALMQPILDDLLAAIESHKLEDWEDREMLAGALATILRASKKIQADPKEKQKLFERICRLDPVQALSVG
jgi:type VI secretion system protein ImpA